jgi:rhodanese-related sulfurtransferase
MSELPIEITVVELAERRKSGDAVRLLDVRELWEFEHAHLEGADHIPMAQVPMHRDTLAGEAEIICYCHTGQRSLMAAQWLRRAGVAGARSLAGGIEQWAVEIDPTVPRY